MTTGADVRRIALSMPEVEEKAHFDRARFRVRNKIFATLWPSKTRAVVKLSLADQSALVAMDPEIFSVNSWSHPGWTNVHLEHISKGQLRNVVRSAWRNVAPKKLAADAASARVCFQTALATELPFEARSFDRVTSSFVMHHLTSSQDTCLRRGVSGS